MVLHVGLSVSRLRLTASVGHVVLCRNLSKAISTYSHLDNHRQSGARVLIRGCKTSSRRFLYLCLILSILLSGVMALFQPSLVFATTPDTPRNVSPSDSATGISLTPTLRSSAFSDPEGDAHAASRWQIRTAAGNYSIPVYDSGADASNLTTIVIPSGLLGDSATYYWHVSYEDNTNEWSAWSAQTSFTTLDITPPVISAVSAINITGTRATITWTTDEVANSQVEYGLTTSYGSSTTLDSNLVTAHSVNLTGLTSQTTYHYRVKSADGSGNSASSADYTFTTLNQPPNQPSNVSPANVSTGMTLTPTLQSSVFHDPDAGDTHGASRWQVTAIPSNYLNLVFDSGTDNLNLTQLTLPAGILNGNTTYYWRVCHQDNYGAWSSWSAQTSFTTLAVTSATGDVTTQGGKVETGDGRIAAQFPAGAVATTATVNIKQVEPSSAAAPKGFKAGSTYFIIEAKDAGGNAIVTLSQPSTITVRYSEADVAVAGGDPNNLVLAYWDGAAGQWKALKTSVDTADMTLSTSTTHLSTWAVLAKTTSGSNGLPSWVWVVIGITAVLAIGTAAYPVAKRAARQ